MNENDQMKIVKKLFLGIHAKDHFAKEERNEVRTKYAIQVQKILKVKGPREIFPHWLMMWNLSEEVIKRSWR